MIDIIKVSEWLTRNVNEKLYPRLLLMSPNGNLLAYSTPVNIKELRDQAALISAAWKDQCTGRQTQSTPDPRKDSARDDAEAAQQNGLKPPLETLTIEAETCNILIRSLQPELLFVLIGELPPNKVQQFKITAEGHGDARHPALEGADTPNESAATQGASRTLKAPSILSSMSQREKDVRLGVLHIQRKRLDALTDYIQRDFKDSGFIMPADWALQ
ncbi:uncharacterized protein M421DRAFT_229687 [Didymella exigua CBS 183.55]|uniref:Roadblock/LAMTOR2 domain-containing protein n=1 Tax=Didymella exigua CBS 183.55 TaxID=1150837 RepID=A0A6A5RFN4_9PLEO|nr:uncharacterized protein M421DRAFT_229687 [Didymella exigua CBS 183.55]KAF1925988.1 hypothetical protein M421DRAFT_229687 [Didymella exigua CBS 183.55]